MWIVRLALRRPYAFIVAALILLLTPFIPLRTPTDIFANNTIPVGSLVWTDSGLKAQEAEEYLDAMPTRIQAEGAEILLLGAWAMRNKSPEYSQAFAGVFPQMATEYVATLSPFLGSGIFGNPESVRQDKSHPNNKEARIIAEKHSPLVVGVIAKTAPWPHGFLAFHEPFATWRSS